MLADADADALELSQRGQHPHRAIGAGQHVGEVKNGKVFNCHGQYRLVLQGFESRGNVRLDLRLGCELERDTAASF